MYQFIHGDFRLVKAFVVFIDFCFMQMTKKNLPDIGDMIKIFLWFFFFFLFCSLSGLTSVCLPTAWEIDFRCTLIPLPVNLLMLEQISCKWKPITLKNIRTQ